MEDFLEGHWRRLHIKDALSFNNTVDLKPQNMSGRQRPTITVKGGIVIVTHLMFQFYLQTS